MTVLYWVSITLGWSRLTFTWEPEVGAAGGVSLLFASLTLHPFCEAVILVFSVNKSGAFQGYARMPGCSARLSNAQHRCDVDWHPIVGGLLGYINMRFLDIDVELGYI